MPLASSLVRLASTLGLLWCAWFLMPTNWLRATTVACLAFGLYPNVSVPYPNVSVPYPNVPGPYPNVPGPYPGAYASVPGSWCIWLLMPGIQTVVPTDMSAAPWHLP